MEFTDSGDIVALALQETPVLGTVLLIQPDSDRVGAFLREQGSTVTEWSWLWCGREAGIWPPEQTFDVVILRLPTIRELTTLVLEVAASRLVSGGSLFIYGANHEGIKSIEDHLAPWFENSEVLLYKHRERVISAIRTNAQEQPRARLEEWRRTVETTINGKISSFISYPGMFAHGTVDQGTALLLAHLPDVTLNARVLDMGCGTGILARAIQERTPSVSIEAVDLNAFAIEAIKQNVPGANAIWGDSWKALSAESKYNLIISNPPVHQGARQTTQPLEYFLSHAKEHLIPGGMITLVVQGTIPVKKYFDRAGVRSQLIAEDTTYQVWQGR